MFRRIQTYLRQRDELLIRIKKLREEQNLLRKDIKEQVKAIKKNHEIISGQNSTLYGGIKNEVYNGMFGVRMPLYSPVWTCVTKTVGISKGKKCKDTKAVDYKDLTDEQKKKFDESMGQADKTFDKADELFKTMGDKNIEVKKG